jgi:hypothetical protein
MKAIKYLLPRHYDSSMLQRDVPKSSIPSRLTRWFLLRQRYLIDPAAYKQFLAKIYGSLALTGQKGQFGAARNSGI